MQKNSESFHLQEILKIFNTNVKEEIGQIKKEFEIFLKSKNKSSKFIESFINDYSRIQINEEISQKMIFRIFYELFSKRKDFCFFFKILMSSTNDSDSNVLKKNFVLKDEENSVKVKAKICFNLSCLNDNNYFYHNFIKGSLQYLQNNFNENYLNVFIDNLHSYFVHIDEPEYYFSNINTFVISLSRIVNDIKRIVYNNSKKMVDNESNYKLIDNKMERNKFGMLMIQSQIYNRTNIYDIYDTSNTDDEILCKVDSLYNNNKDDLFILLFKESIEKFIKEKRGNIENELLKKNTEIFLQSNELNSIKEKLELMEINDKKQSAKINEQEKKINKQEKKINEQEKKINEQERKINEQERKINEHENEISALKAKVEYMEPIIISLMCRKGINFCFRKILEKYKKNVKVTVKTKDKKNIYIIKFIETVGGICVNDLNRLLEELSLKKPVFNNDSHLINKDMPPYIDNFWNLFKSNLRLARQSSYIFDIIITDNIKKEFDFGGKDLSLEDYLKDKNLNQFGK